MSLTIQDAMIIVRPGGRYNGFRFISTIGAPDHLFCELEISQSRQFVHNGEC